MQRSLLGQAYRFFLSPAPDRSKAIYWYTRAADTGLAEAQYQLAEIMFEESSTRQHGMELLIAAANQGPRRRETRASASFFNSVRTSGRITRAPNISTKSQPAGRPHRAQQSGVAAGDEPEREAPRRHTRGDARATARRSLRQLGLPRHTRCRPSRSR
jgi:TPR repeat protein